MKPTTFKNILSFIFLAAIVGYLIPNIYENLTATYIPVSSNTVIALLLLNLTLLYWIVIFKNRLKDAREKTQDISKR